MPFAQTGSQWTRLLAGGLLFAAASVLVLASVPLLFGSPQPMVRVRWGDISASNRTSLERQFHLTEAAALDDRLWAYVPIDTSPVTLRAIVSHPAVEDTDGINRRTFAIADNPPLTPRRGGLVGGAPAWMARGGRALAYLLAGIAGVLLIAAALPRVFPLFRGAAGMGVHWLRSRNYTFTAVSKETAMVVAFLLVAIAWRFLTFTGFSNDHYAHLAMAQQLLMGDRPIRDFADPGWPLMYILTAIGWLVAGKAMATEWVITTGGFAIGAACTAAAGYRLSGSLAIAATVTAIEILIFPRAYSYPKILMYAAAGWAMLGLGAHPSTRRLVIMGSIIATAFLFRHDHGVFIGLAAAVCVVLASRTDGWRVAARRVSLLAATTGLLLLPWIIFVTFNGGMVSYLQRGLDFSRIEADATRLSAWPVFSTTGSPITTANAEAWLFWLFWGLVVVCGAAAVRRIVDRRERWPGEGATVVALAIVGAFVNATFLRESLQVRIPDAVVPAALLAAWALGLCVTERWQRRGWQRAVSIAAMIAVIVSSVAAGLVAGLVAQFDDSGLNRGLNGIRAQATEVAARLRSPHSADASSRFVVALRPFFAYLDRCTEQSDRLIVTSDAPDVPVVAKRRFAGDGVVFGSTYASSRYQDQTMARLRAAPALFVLHMGGYETFRERFERVDAYVNEQFTHMADVEVEEGGTVQILVNRSRHATSTDAQTGWPCFGKSG